MSKQLRGFAVMSPEKRREIASMGGKAAQKNGNCHRFDSVEASAAGRIGGLKISANKAHMAAIGRKGGLTCRLTKVAQKGAL